MKITLIKYLDIYFYYTKIVSPVDGIVVSSVLEYVVNPEECLCELSRVCRPGAWAFLTVPNLWHPLRWIESGIRRVAPKGHGFFPQRVEDYLEYLKLSTSRFPVARWREVLASSGWSCDEIRGWREPLLLLVARCDFQWNKSKDEAADG